MKKSSKFIKSSFLSVLLLMSMVFVLVSCSKGNKGNTASSVTPANTETKPVEQPVATPEPTPSEDVYSEYQDGGDFDYEDIEEETPEELPYEEEVVSTPVSEVTEEPKTEETVSAPVEEEVVVSTPTSTEEVEQAPEDDANIPVTLPLVNDEYPVEIGTPDALTESEIESAKIITHSFIINANPYSLALSNDTFHKKQSLFDYGFNASLEYRMHVLSFLFVGIGGGVEYYKPLPYSSRSITDGSIFAKIGGTVGLTKHLSLDLFASIGMEFNNYYYDSIVPNYGAGFDFDVAFNEHFSLLLGFEYKYSANKRYGDRASIQLHRFTVPTLAFSYTI